MAKETTEAPKAPKKIVITAQTDFNWAYNKIKLKQSYAAVVEAKKLDPSVVIDEQAIRDMYISKAGLLAEEQAVNILKKRPRSTSNIRE